MGITSSLRNRSDGTATSPISRTFGEARLQTAGELLAMAFLSPDILCTVEEPGVLRRWNVPVKVCENSAFLSDLETVWQFCPEGKALITASDELSIWDTSDGELITALLMPTWVTAVAIRRTPVLIATGHDEGVVRLWDPARHRLVRELAGHDRPITAIAFSVDGHRIATAAADRLIQVWDVSTGEQLGTLGRHTDHICSLIWHPGEKLLFSAGWDRTARVWDTQEFEPVMLLNSHADQVVAMAMDPKGTWLACADSEPAVRIWDLQALREHVALAPLEQEVRALAFAVDGKTLAIGTAGGRITLWSPHSGEPIAGANLMSPHRARPSVQVNEKRLYAVNVDGSILAWDVANGERCHALQETNPVDCFALSPNGSTICAGVNGEIIVRDAATGAFRRSLSSQKGKFAAMGFAPDSITLASASAEDGSVWLWNVDEGEPKLVIPVAADSCAIHTLAFHPDGRTLAVAGADWLATSGTDGAICLWDTVERQIKLTLDRGARSIAFHPNGDRMAAATIAGAIDIWDVLRGKRQCRLPETDAKSLAVAFSSDGRFLVATDDDRTLRTWDIDSAELIAACPLDDIVESMCFSADDQMLFCGNSHFSCFEIPFPKMLERFAV